MKVDFWKNYDEVKDNLTNATPLRIDIEHRTWWGDKEYSNLDWVRINAYAKANNIDLNETPVDADFMNTMEEWYLKLAEKEMLFNEFLSKDDTLKITFNDSQYKYIRIADNATNGQVLLQMFPPSVYFGDNEKHLVLLTKDCELTCYNNEWWNAKFKR